MNHINLTDTEATNWQISGMFLRILPKQPPDGYEYKVILENVVVFHKEEQTGCYTIDRVQNVRKIVHNKQKLIKLPFTVGNIVGCRETWLWSKSLKRYLGI